MIVIGIKTGIDDFLCSDLFVDPEHIGQCVEGEAKLEVGVEHTALHVVDGHGMNVVFVGIEAIRKACVSFNTADNRLLIGNRYGFGVKVDGAGGCGMRAAEVEHQLVINKYPQVVVTGEVEGLGSTVLVQTVCVQTKLDSQLHAEALVVSIMVGCVGVIINCVVFNINARICCPCTLFIPTLTRNSCNFTNNSTISWKR